MGVGYIIIGEPSLFTCATTLLNQLYPHYKLYRIGQVVAGAREITLCE
jgi:hypothetical protein